MVLHRATLFTAALAAASVVGAACGPPSHPPELDDRLDGSASGRVQDSGSTLFDDTGPVERSCNLGPEGGVCACADEPIAIDPTTLYFVLDRSGSMNDMNKWDTVRSALGNLIVALGPRAKLGAAVFPDPMGSNECAPGREVFAPQQGDAPAGTAGPTETAFLQTLGAIGANGGTPTAATLQALAPHIAQLPGKKVVVLATDGGPNCDAGAMCTAATCTFNIEGAAGCPVGGPGNCCAPDAGAGGALSCLDAQPTIDAVTAIAQAGVPVYVVGVPGSQPYAALLDQLAQTGGTARGSEPQYYAVDTADQAAFYAAMSKIAAKVTASCILTLNAVPPDPTQLNVFLDGNVLPQSGPDGWMLTGTIIIIEGASCQKIKDGDVLDVRIVAGCPTVTQ